MQRIIINNETLDTDADFSLEIVRTNLLFAFDEAACDRSTSFELPRTPKNDRLLALAGRVSAQGDMMRQRVSATLNDGVINWSGYLFVESHDHKQGMYSCSFIFGELLPLYDIKQAGKINTLVGDIGVARYSSNVSDWISAAPPALVSTYAPIAYHVDSEDGILHPSVDMEYLLTTAAITLNTNISWPSSRNKFRLITGEVKGIRDTTGKMTETDTTGTYYANVNLALACLGGTIWSQSKITLKRTFGSITEDYDIQAYKAEAHVTITFPSDVPSNIRLIYDTYPFTSWRGVSYVDDDPIAGRTYDVPRGTVLTIVDENNFQYVSVQQGSGYYTTFEIPQGNPTYTLRGAGDLEDGQLVRGIDNVPELGFIELMQAWASLSGLVLTYDGQTNTFSFDPLDWESWQRKEVDKVVEIGTVERQFADWGQKNVIQFDSDDEVRDKIVRSYNITNVNLDKEVELQTLPFSEGNITGSNSLLTSAKSLTVGMTSGLVTPSLTYMSRVSLPNNTTLASLANISTRVDMRLLFSPVEYALLTDKTLILHEHLLFVWTSAEWSEGEISLTLAKII